MRNVTLLVAALSLGGCQIIQDGQDLLSGLTNPLATQAIVLGVETPSDAEDIEFPDEFSDGAGATVFLADAADVADIDNAPVSGANVTLEGESLSEDASGTYLLEPDALSYEAETTWTTQIEIGGDTAEGRISLPAAASFEVPSGLPSGEGVTIDLTGQGFDGAFVVVVRADGEITFDNRPETPRAFYDFTRGDPATTIDIPAEAFDEGAVFAIGVAGIRSTTGRDAVDAMNTALSTLMAGQMVFEPVAKIPNEP